MICLMTLLLLQQPSFDAVKEKIALFESSGGKFKFNWNSNGTVDCGKWHINSSHFKLGDSTKLGRAYQKIFLRHGTDYSYHARIAAAIMDDALNEDLARELYNLRGGSQWTSWGKVLESMKPAKKAIKRGKQ